MTLANTLLLSGAVAGAIGTALLFFGTYGFEPPAGAFFVDDRAIQQKINRRNARRRLQQRAGLALLMASFVLQGTAVFL